ncbi:hypothetical protein BGZ60DRAFT_410378 [Tricladium varicosporioides]|nr:hypothetical protein BGZ60DRAFT_410378 [Hymenoscyphus varicosporioides]
MIASRSAARAAARTLRAAPRTPAARQANNYATNTQKEAAKIGGSSGLVGGLTGGALVFLAGYSYYHFSGAKSIVNAASTTKSEFQKLTNSLQSTAPEPNEAIKWLRQTATSYAAFIPGGKSYVDSAFNDLETVQKKHAKEVEDIVGGAYKELKDASKGGISMETAAKSWSVIEKAVKKLGELASDSAEDVLNNHPQLKEKVGGQVDQLRSMADSYGPDAKKELDDMWKGVSEAIKGGVGLGNVEKIKQLIQEKIEKVKKLGDEAWKKGLKEAKPFLDKNPEVKKLVEENADNLKQGNISELFEQVKGAVQSGNLDDLKRYVNDSGEKFKKSGVGKNIEQYVNMIPGGKEVLPKLMKLQEVVKSRGDEAESILKDTYKDISDVLQKRTGEVEKLAEKAKEDSKR